MHDIHIYDFSWIYNFIRSVSRPAAILSLLQEQLSIAVLLCIGSDKFANFTSNDAQSREDSFSEGLYYTNNRVV